MRQIKEHLNRKNTCSTIISTWQKSKDNQPFSVPIFQAVPKSQQCQQIETHFYPTPYQHDPLTSCTPADQSPKPAFALSHYQLGLTRTTRFHLASRSMRKQRYLNCLYNQGSSHWLLAKTPTRPIFRRSHSLEYSKNIFIRCFNPSRRETAFARILRLLGNKRVILIFKVLPRKIGSGHKEGKRKIRSAKEKNVW